MRFNILTKQLIGYLIVVLMMIGQGVFVLTQIDAINQETAHIGKSVLPSINHINNILHTANDYRRQQLQHLTAADKEARAKHEETMTADEAKMVMIFSQAQLLIRTEEERNYFETIQKGWNLYIEQSSPFLLSSRNYDSVTASKVLNGDALLTFDKLAATMNDWKDFNNESANAGLVSAEQRNDLTLKITIGLLVATVFIAAGIGIFQARSISGGARKMVDVAEEIVRVDLAGLASAAGAIAKGDLTPVVALHTQPIVYSSSDEIGDLANAFNQIIASLHQTGEDFAQMSANLRLAIGQVADNAHGLQAASGSLAEAASQADQATIQIASIIQQVAHGTSQQTESIEHTAYSVDQMGKAINKVAEGAQEQSQVVNNVSEITRQLTAAIQKVSVDARASAQGADKAASVAQGGAQTVATTITKMGNIQDKVKLSAQKVEEMGQHSRQIDSIVVLIEDIADQTNLLALNATIEAARAGEHGKSFAVVADEVRKLAERSGGATKEISSLVKRIQRTTVDAITAMNEGFTEVEMGVNQANLAGQALTEILQAAGEVNQQVTGITSAAEEMGKLSDKLVAAMDAVSMVVEDNTASTEEMNAGSTEMTESIENIASVSEENAAAVQEVSASAEEMSAQVEQVSTSARELAGMANSLQSIVAQFILQQEDLPSQSPDVQHVPHISAIETEGDITLTAQMENG